MGFRRDVGVYSHRELRWLAMMCCARCQQLQLACALDVEQQDPAAKRSIDFFSQLADPGENYLGRGFWCGRDHSLQLTARYDVESRSQPREHPQN